KTLGVEVEKNEDGIFKLVAPPPPVPVFGRFHEGYLYFTIQDPKALAVDTLISPKAFFTSPVDEIVATVFPTRVPTATRKLFLGQVEERVAATLPKKPVEERDAKEAMTVFVAEAILNMMECLFSECQKSELGVNVDVKQEQMQIRLDSTPVKGSDLAKRLKTVAERPNEVAQPLGSASTVLAMQSHFDLPPVTLKRWNVLMAAVEKTTVSQADDFARPIIQSAMESAMPTLTRGRFDMNLRMEPQPPTQADLMMTLGAKEGESLEGLLKEYGPKIPGADYQRMNGAMEKASVHQLSEIPADTQRIFGEGTIAALTAPNVVGFAISNSNKKLTEYKPAPAKTPILVGQLNVAWLLHANIPLHRLEEEGIAAYKKDLLASLKDSAKNRVTLQADGGDTLSVQLKGSIPAMLLLKKSEAMNMK
ncbi:MAG: hypothetical protein ACRCZF_22820, partial [Gemmataceae bacterium]